MKKFRLQRFYFSVASVFRCSRSVWIISVSVMKKIQTEEVGEHEKVRFVIHTGVSSGLMWITEQLDAFNLTSSNEANRLTSNLPA